MNEENDERMGTFKITGPDEDGIYWLYLHVDKDWKSALFNIGEKGGSYILDDVRNAFVARGEVVV